jgi:hypothetical protein
MKIISIHQPGYFPWLGLLNKINQSDIFVVMDDVQLNDNAFQSRNVFFDMNIGSNYLTIPIAKKGHLDKTIKDIVIHDKIWQKKHSKFLIANYKRTPHFEEIFNQIEEIYLNEYKYLFDVLLDSMKILNNIFDIKTQIVLQSSLMYDKESTKGDLVLNIIEALKLEKKMIYLSGTGAKNYQHDEDFRRNNIELKYQNFIHPIYIQHTNKNEFISGLSALDLAFNIGIEQSKSFFKVNL